MTNEEQAVVEQPDEQAEPVSEDANAQDLESLLAEYSETGEAEEKKEEPETVTSTTDLRKELAEISSIKRMLVEDREREARNMAKTELNKTVKSIKGDLSIPDDHIKAFLDVKSRNDPRLERAYLAKDQKPEQWSAIETKLRTELQNFVESLVSKDATETREAIASSVFNAKSTIPNSSSIDLSKMSDLEFEAFKKKQFKREGL